MILVQAGDSFVVCDAAELGVSIVSVLLILFLIAMQANLASSSCRLDIVLAK